MPFNERTKPRTLFRAAMASLLVFNLVPLMARVAPATTPFWDGVLDGVRGAALGACIALIAVSGVLRRRTDGDESSHCAG